MSIYTHLLSLVLVLLPTWLLAVRLCREQGHAHVTQLGALLAIFIRATFDFNVFYRRKICASAFSSPCFLYICLECSCDTELQCVYLLLGRGGAENLTEEVTTSDGHSRSRTHMRQFLGIQHPTRIRPHLVFISYTPFITPIALGAFSRLHHGRPLCTAPVSVSLRLFFNIPTPLNYSEGSSIHKHTRYLRRLI